jgi:hypothetical protein
MNSHIPFGQEGGFVGCQSKYEKLRLVSLQKEEKSTEKPHLRVTSTRKSTDLPLPLLSLDLPKPDQRLAR